MANLRTSRFYKGSNNLNDFPSPVKVLIIVTNATEFKQSLYDRPFLFELRLGWKIQVTVFGVVESITKPVDILMYRLQEHAGWSFKIKGPYKPEGADTASRMKVSGGLITRGSHLWD